MHVAFTSPVLWLNILLISGFCGLIEYFILSFFFVFKKSTVTILQRLYNQKGLINSEEDLPKSIKEKLNLYNEIDQKMEDMQIKKDDIVNNQLNEEKNRNDININDIEVKKKEKELNTKMNNEGNINTGFGLNNINNEDIENNNDKNEDLKSENALLNNKDSTGDKNTAIGKEDKLPTPKDINNDKISHKNNENEEDFGENYTEGFSEQMSKEDNIIIKSNNYFTESWNLKSKIKTTKDK
jgi:hypothetical protein